MGIECKQDSDLPSRSTAAEGGSPSLELIYIFIVASTLTFFFIVSIYAIRNIHEAGSKAFLLQILCVSIWSLGSLAEMLSTTEAGMLFWRNFEQLGVFFLPVACVYFALDYARYDRLKRYLPLLLIVPVLAIVLIFTDGSTHLMRTGYLVSYSPLFGKALSVHQTNLGKILVAYNYLLALVTVVILFVFSRQVAKKQRRQVLLVLSAIALVFVLGFLKSAFLEGTRFNVPIMTIYLPGSLILFNNIYRNNFFRVSPIARDKVFDVIDMGIIVTDSTGMISDTNPCAVSLLNARFGIVNQLSGKKMAEVFPDYPDWLNLTQNNASGELELRLTNSELHFIHIRVYPLQSASGALVGSVSIMRDVTDVRMQEFALKTKAATDGLTLLMNRESFMEELEKRLHEAQRTREHVSVLMMDLDKFKGINDTYGHDDGDRVLRAVADVLKEVLRHQDAIARIGGDEFAAILSGVTRREAAEIANRIIKAANQKVIHLGSGDSVALKLSIGVCDNQSANSEEDLLKCADKAMYLAKGRTGNCCIEWE